VKHVRKGKGYLLFLPVRRDLAVFTMSYLAGLYLSKTAVISAVIAGVFCALSLLCAAARWRKRKSALLCLSLSALLAGNLYAGIELARRDLPTAYGVQIDGVVSAIEKPYRVMLSDVVIDGSRVLERSAVVTLMNDEEDLPPPALVGQHISGTGRLFAPDEKRNPGGIEQRIQTIVEGYELSGYILPGWTAEGRPVFSIRETLRQWREYCLKRLEWVFSDRASFLQGIMLGEKHAMDEEVAASMRLTGTIHLLTVSGMHLSMIARLLRLLLSRTPLSRKTGAIAIGVFLAFFVGLTGGAPGTIRACLMTMLRELAALRGRKYEPLTALAFSALVMTLARPLWVFSASFQFSFLIVLGIILLAGGAGIWLDRLIDARGIFRRLIQAAAVSLCAQIASLPLQLLFYGYIPMLALPMNIVGALLVPGLMIAGWICMIASLLSLEAGRLLAQPVCAAAEMFERVSVLMADVQGSILRLPAPFEITVLMCFALMMIVSRKIRFGRAKAAAASLLCMLITLSYLLRFDLCPQYVQLDVGQGDAAAIREGRHAVLSDVGPSGSYEMLRYLRHEGLYIDAVMLSHLDADHAGGLSVLLHSEMDIPANVMAEGAMDRETAQEVEQALDLALERGIPIHTLQKGDSISVGGIQMNILSPRSGIAGTNERSLLINACLGGYSMLLTGDLPQSCEPVLIPDCDILKVAHHGSKYATSDAFVHMARPEIALISVGKNNPYGHPGKRVLDALEAEGTKILRTDEGGCLTIRLEGKGLRAESFIAR